MKFYRAIEIKSNILSKTTCDICGKDTNEKEIITLIDRVEDWHDHSESYKVTRETYDFCGKCYKEKLKEFLNILGAKATVISETDD